jgi:hypothetical protein
MNLHERGLAWAADEWMKLMQTWLVRRTRGPIDRLVRPSEMLTDIRLLQLLLCRAGYRARF